LGWVPNGGSSKLATQNQDAVLPNLDRGERLMVASEVVRANANNLGWLPRTQPATP
tara:strand:+ start:1199 stop:1366 length:168 start_codon:yes stop_codon:yes gene_type:complete